MNTALLLPLIAVGLIGLSVIAVTVLTAKSVVVMLASLALLAITPSISTENGGPDLDGAQKAVLVLVLALIVAKQGVVPRATPIIAAIVLSVSLLFSMLPNGGLLDASPDVAVRAYIGYLLPWLFMLIKWRGDQGRAVLRVAMYIPVCIVPFGIVVQGAGIWSFIATNDGSPRLAGSSIPAHLGLMTVVAVFAAAVEFVLFTDPKHATIWLLVNLVLMFGTITRGAIISGIIIVAALVIWSFTKASERNPIARRNARAVGGTILVLAAIVMPVVILRSQGNSYEGAFNTSGREQAWPFFFALGAASPLIGRGLGLSSVALDLFQPVGVQSIQAPHNEYLHFFVDGGVFLLVGVLTFVGVGLALAIRAAPKGSRIVVAAIVPVLAIYAAVDNPFSTPQFSVPFALVLSAIMTIGGKRRADEAASRAASAVTTPALAPADAVLR